MAEDRPRLIRRSNTTSIVPPFNNELIVFTVSDRVAKVKRKKRLKPAGIFLDDKNRFIIELVIAFGFLSRFQLSDLLGIPSKAIHKRAHRLSACGLLDGKSRGASGEVLYVPTRLGMRSVGMAKGFKVTTPTFQTMNHKDGLVATALRFMESPNRHGLVVTEQEITAAVATGQLSPRIRRQAPWAQEQFQDRFKTWLPVADAISGTGKGFKRPDMLLIKEGQPPTAVELEVTQKSSNKAYAGGADRWL